MLVPPMSAGHVHMELLESKLTETVYFQHLAKYLPLQCPKNVLLVVVCFFCLFVFSFLSFISSLAAFITCRHTSGIIMLVPRRPVDIRGMLLIYNLTTAQPRRGYAWHIMKNSCIFWWDKLLQTRMLLWKTGPKKLHRGHRLKNTSNEIIPCMSIKYESTL